MVKGMPVGLFTLGEQEYLNSPLRGGNQVEKGKGKKWMKKNWAEK